MGPAGEAPAVVTEAQGWRLHLSSRSSTGYAGAGVGLARLPTSLGVGPLRGVPHGGRTTSTTALRLGGGGGGGTRGRRGRWTDRSPPAGREVR